MLKPGKVSVYKIYITTHGPSVQNLRTTQNLPTPQAGKTLGPPAQNLRNQSHTPELGGKTSSPIRPKTQTIISHHTQAEKQLAQYGPNNNKTHKAQTQAKLKA